jgi:hypothetical protein
MHTYYLKYITLYSNIIKNNVLKNHEHLHIIGYILICHPKLLMYLIHKKLQYSDISIVLIKILQGVTQFG